MDNKEYIRQARIKQNWPLSDETYTIYGLSSYNNENPIVINMAEMMLLYSALHEKIMKYIDNKA